jgi:hypothetical protein
MVCDPQKKETKKHPKVGQNFLGKINFHETIFNLYHVFFSVFVNSNINSLENELEI